MPDSFRVIISPRALSDIEGIYRYIANDSPRNARAILRRLMSAIDSLELFPYRNEVYQGRRPISETVRRMPVNPFILYYRVNDEQGVVDVITIRHGKRLQPRRFGR
ncbi:MAG: type II toxin-antitoxin system RelE/ParE family toxin [Phycisphaerales bacterium]|nr:type II toxin-antitoxin system RelE/ParE family toxin [Phycisphaerales bacterium]